MSNFNDEAANRLREYLGEHDLSKGVGSHESACSIAAINLALSNELTDDIPTCMSEVLGKWIIVIQDAVPAHIRNSWEWKELLPLAAGTGRNHEQERLDLIQEWMWATVLPQTQPLADKLGFGDEWREMCVSRTESAARSATRSAARSARSAESAAWSAESAARSAAWSAARSAESATRSAESAAWSAAWSAESAARSATRSAGDQTAIDEFWANVDVINVFRSLVKLS